AGSCFPGCPSLTTATVRIKPDSSGRFGFNVKGGADQDSPILVSRVAPNSPADLTEPRLRQGDQLLYINGRDLGGHTHEQAVQFIRAAAERHSGELLLVVRQRSSTDEEAASAQLPVVPITIIDPADCDYRLDKDNIDEFTDEQSDDNDRYDDSSLMDSMRQLQLELESGVALDQFDRLFRRKPGLSMSAARRPENLAKNRYRDINDATRVTLSCSPNCSQASSSSKSGDLSISDYINASHVDMRIPSPCGTVNRYIAAQGPLPNTCSDFWQMCWEQSVSLVVMLTVSNERGRTKCHEYWPPLYETVDHCNGLSVTCVSEQVPKLFGNAKNSDNDDIADTDRECGFAQREFMISKTADAETAGEGSEVQQRQVTHLQYADWPDHGTPSNLDEFLNFVSRVRAHRAGHLAPVVVHCSAGIGRTGVLIAMETAVCLIEAGLPVKPLCLLRRMRNQRPMLIQTAGQYRFVCEAVLRYWQQSGRGVGLADHQLQTAAQPDEANTNSENNNSASAC
uniref:Protein-tyrosine-phosphatase n=1 Tax=Macrostomum lignano TaxID=282301 RepID=A0A1I8IDH4_9PLAT